MSDEAIHNHNARMEADDDYRAGFERREEEQELAAAEFQARQFRYKTDYGQLFGGKSGICRVAEWHDEGVCIVADWTRGAQVYFRYDQITLEEIK